MKKGINLTGMPVLGASTVTSYNMLETFPLLREFGQYNSGLQLLETAATIFNTSAGVVFTLSRGVGYFINVADAMNLQLTGSILHEPLAVALIPGLNFISFPFATEVLDRPLLSMDSWEFLQQSPDILEIHCFDKEKQSFSKTTFRLGTKILGDRFTLNLDQGYFIRTAASVTVTPQITNIFGFAAVPAPSLAPVQRASASPTLQNVEIRSVHTCNLSEAGFDVLVEVTTPARVSIMQGEKLFSETLGNTKIAKTHLISLPAHLPATIIVDGTRVRVTKELLLPPVAVSGSGIPVVVTGRIIDSSMNPAGGQLVLLVVEDGKTSSLPLAVKTDAAGFWYANLGNLRNQQGAIIKLTDNAQAVVSAVGFDSSLRIPLVGDSPLEAEDLIVR
jgi:hypothetical protein